MIAGTLPELSTYSVIAEQMRRLDMMTLQGNWTLLHGAKWIFGETVLDRLTQCSMVRESNGIFGLGKIVHHRSNVGHL